LNTAKMKAPRARPTSRFDSQRRLAKHIGKPEPHAHHTAPGLHGVTRVQQEIDQHLGDAVMVAEDRRQLRLDFSLHRDAGLLAKLLFDHRQRILQDSRRTGDGDCIIAALRVDVGASVLGVIAQHVDDAGTAKRALLDQFDGLHQFGATDALIVQFIDEIGARSGDDADRVR